MADYNVNNSPTGGGESTRNLRKRNINVNAKSQDSKNSKKTPKQPSSDSFSTPVSLKPGTYWLTRIVLLRFLGLIYAVAFLVALNQNKQLIGSDGLTPASQYLQQVRVQSEFPLQQFVQCPTLLWLVEGSKHFDLFLDLVAYLGIFLSVLVLVTGAANVFTMLTLWFLYHSLVNVGQHWYSFGWESQVLETGFLAIFFCPLVAWSALPKSVPPSWVVVCAYRWLLFRIMIGAGLIKLRGDKCWWDLTCMNHHYETQPVPNPVSYYLHQSPDTLHLVETFVNHIIELIVPWFMFLTRGFRITCGILQIFFQTVLIVSGNLSFLNWLTILPSLAFFDDKSWSFLFSEKTRSKVGQLQTEELAGKLEAGRTHRIKDMSLFLVLTYLSIPVVINLMSSHQIMNTSFEPFRIVNTYGAFGSITKERTEVIFQGTHSENPYGPTVEWLEYEFKCKPGNISRHPCIVSPYHYRLDWLLWFAAFQDYKHNPWILHLTAKLLRNDPTISTLLAHNPFLESKPPRFIRIEHYSYHFTTVGSAAARRGEWWTRNRLTSYLSPVSLSTLKPLTKKWASSKQQ